MYEQDLNALIDGESTAPALRRVSLGRSPSITEYALVLTAGANAKVGSARHVLPFAVREVVVRENNARVGQDKKLATFGILRAVENFLSAATLNISSTPHVDLLPLGHPSLFDDSEALTASAFVEERAAWEAGTLDAKPQTKALVASILGGDPVSAEYKFAVVRLRASAPDVLARIV